MNERVAGFADIDTRRAMGFLPRKLPKSELIVRPEKHRKDGGPVTVISFNTPNTTLIIEDHKYIWVFGFTDTAAMMIYDTKSIYTVSSFGRTETYTHPDFNDDGSFKRALKINVTYSVDGRAHC